MASLAGTGLAVLQVAQDLAGLLEGGAPPESRAAQGLAEPMQVWAAHALCCCCLFSYLHTAGAFVQGQAAGVTLLAPAISCAGGFLMMASSKLAA